jgi:hypothetical protein
MVRELGVGERFTGFSFVRSEVLGRGVGDHVERHGHILVVSDLLEVDVRNLVVVDFGGVVIDVVSGEFGEVRGHDGVCYLL